MTGDEGILAVVHGFGECIRRYGAATAVLTDGYADALERVPEDEQERLARPLSDASAMLAAIADIMAKIESDLPERGEV